MRRILGIVVLMAFAATVSAQQVRIGLYNDEVVQSVVVSCASGEYMVRSDGAQVAVFEKGDVLYIKNRKDSVLVHDEETVFGIFKELEFLSLTQNSAFSIRPVEPILASRVFDDDLLVHSEGMFLMLINRVEFDKYIAGVLETEVGPNAEKELYKAHALLSRTYLLKHFERHEEEGFSLCDGVHCQAYNGKAVYNPDIADAVDETTGEVVADYHYKLIEALYHANSGGETMRAADVWLKDVDYLQAVIDPYSLHQSRSKWYDTIYFDDWKKYLLDQGMKSVEKLPEEIIYVQQRHRRKYFVLDQDSLLMTKIRADFGWNSTFFNMFPEPDGKIVIWGKGYGHGVGLSQQGAMKMAADGYSYKDIIRFYYFNIRIMDYEDLPASSLPDDLY